jgi:hypothetical protein
LLTGVAQSGFSPGHCNEELGSCSQVEVVEARKPRINLRIKKVYGKAGFSLTKVPTSTPLPP